LFRKTPAASNEAFIVDLIVSLREDHDRAKHRRELRDTLAFLSPSPAPAFAG